MIRYRKRKQQFFYTRKKNVVNPYFEGFARSKIGKTFFELPIALDIVTKIPYYIYL